MSEIFSPVRRAAMSAWQPPDIRKAWQWCEDHVEVDRTSPMPGKWRSANSPWVKEVMEECSNKRNRFIAVKCAAQSSKTQSLLGLLLWCVAEDPGPTMYVLANADDAADFVRDRFDPSMKRCKPVRDLLLRETKLAYTFRTMPLYFVGAGSPAKLQGKPMKRVFFDEVRNYPPGVLETGMKRVRAFGELAQIFIISTPDTKGDSVDRAFLQGDQRTFHFACPRCQAMQQLRFEQLKAQHPETHFCVSWKDVPGAKHGEQWNYEALGKALRYECVQCGQLIADTPAERKAICRNGQFIRMNPNAEPGDVSFTWNALLPWWVPWKGIAKEFLLARAAIRGGDIGPMKTFVTETLGDSWEDRLGVIEDFGFLEARKGGYDFGDAWPEGKRRFMAADRQEAGGEHYYWTVRAFGDFGKSRLVAYGTARSKEELEAIRKEHNVAAGDAMVDTGYQAQDTYRFCASTGWKAFKGDQVQYYIVTLTDPRNPARRIPVRQIWRKSQAIVYNAETKAKIGAIPLFTFSSESTKDLLLEYMTGLVGEWTLAKTTEKQYLKHLAAERREENTDPKGRITYFWRRLSRDNHWFDCEQMILVAAIAAKVIAFKVISEASPADDPALVNERRNPVTGQTGQAAVAV